MAGKIQDVIMEFPMEMVKKCSGFALDIGGSAVKIVYLSKKDWQKIQDKESVGRTAPLHMVTCGREDLDEVLDVVADDIQIKRGDGESTLFSCGLGGFQFNQKLEEKLGIKLENVVESDCLFYGIKFLLSSLKEKDLIWPQYYDDIDMVTEVIQQILGMLETMAQSSNVNYFSEVSEATSGACDRQPLSSDMTVAEKYGDQLHPYLILLLGSGFGFLLVKKEGPPRVVDTVIRGGRYFMGMASLLTGIKSYDEFVDLAEKGNNLNVDMSVSSLSEPIESKDDSDPYAKLLNKGNENVIFAFGKAVFKDLGDFRREDVARSWLCTHMDEVAGIVHHQAATNGVKHVFVVGSLTNRELVRRVLTMELTRKDGMMTKAYGKQFHPTLHFMKNGGHACAVGALLNSINKFTKTR